MVLRELLQLTSQSLSEHFGEFALPYTEKILQYILNCNRSELYLDSNRVVPGEVFSVCKKIVERCCSGEPLEYITGVAFFYNREFAVSPDVLIPRPDTETLVETVLQHEPSRNALFADVGSGSGILSCILTEQRSEWVAVAVDISIRALKMTKKNSCSRRILPVCGNMTEMLQKGTHFDFIVTNPPYIPAGDIQTLSKSVREYEPHTALDGGDDGLDYYRYCSENLPPLLRSGGALYGEIGYDQADRVSDIFFYSSWQEIEFFRDLSGYKRVFRVKAMVQ